MQKIILAFLSVALIGIAAHYEKTFIINTDGAVEYYLFKNGSDCEIVSKEELKKRPFDLFSIKGYCLKGADESFAKETLEKTKAVFVFEEFVGDRRSKYYYSDKIWGYNLVNGQKVNIHVAYDGESYAIGSPTIYGAY